MSEEKKDQSVLSSDLLKEISGGKQSPKKEERDGGKIIIKKP